VETYREILLNSIISFVPFPITKLIGDGKPLIFYYHIISNEKVPHVYHLYEYKGIKAFCDDLEFLTKYYRPVSLSDVISWINGETALFSDSFLLTFDDGFREVYDIVSPILLKKGIPAAFFIPSASLDNRELCYKNKVSLLIEKMVNSSGSREEKEITRILCDRGIFCSGAIEGLLKVDYRRRDILEKAATTLQLDIREYLDSERPYLTSDQVRDLIKWGFEIGAHSIDHPLYSSLSFEEQIYQTVESVKWIRKSFNLDYGVFAFPHSDVGVSRKFFDKIRKTGLIDLTFGTSGMLKDSISTNLQRVSLEKPMKPARDIISYQIMRKVYRTAIGQVKIMRF